MNTATDIAVAVIARCTRNGVTSWQHVAAQLGRSVDSVRSQYDGTYLRSRPFAGTCEEMDTPPDQQPIDENDLSSPYVKGPGLKAEILALLDKQALSAATLATMLNSPMNSIRARLDRLLEDGKVWHDGAYPRTWGVIEKDGTRRGYGATPLGSAAGIAQFGGKFSSVGRTWRDGRRKALMDSSS